MSYDNVKPIRLSLHALEQCKERGTNEEEVREAIRLAQWVPTQKNRLECKYSFQFNAQWSGRFYAIKEVRPIFVDEEQAIVVVTVITYYN